MRYLGSKQKIKGFIIKAMEEIVGELENLIVGDLFCGTASIAQELKKRNVNLITNDYMNFSYVLQHALIITNEIPEFLGLSTQIKNVNYNKVLNYLNNISGYDGFIYSNYTLEGTAGQEYKRNYFSAKNARKIDGIRTMLDVWIKEELITQVEFYFLLTSLLESVSKVSNTSGTYGAFLKIDDNRKFNKLMLEEIDLIKSSKKHIAHNCDISLLIKKLKGDVLYLDPPYNNRQYPAYYHILETIALWDNPRIYGLTGRRPYEDKKSPFCNKATAYPALDNIISKANFKHIFISYSADGIIKVNEMIDMLSKHGSVDIFDKTHRRYRSNSFNNRENKVKELLFYVKKREKTI